MPLAIIVLAGTAGGLAAAENGLGLTILPAPPAGQLSSDAIQFAAWPTRVRDFERFVAETHYNATAGAISLARDGWKVRGDSWRHPGFDQSSDDPVVCVSYFDALAFCRWLTKSERTAGRLDAKHCYRLPTDAEWQALIDWAYDGLKYPWSAVTIELREAKDWPPGWYHGNYAGEEMLESGFWPESWECAKGYRDDFSGTAPVTWGGGERWGYHDLSGNVRQWTSTAFRRDMNRDEIRAKHRFLDGEAEALGKSAKVTRGAGWNDYLPGLLELNTRVPREPHIRKSDVGFRIVLAPGEVLED